MKTFYIASSFYNKKKVRELAEFLRHLGMDWHLGHDWTFYDFPNHDPRAPETVLEDVQCAANCDFFIFLHEFGMMTKGAWAEFGGRLAVSKPAHVIQNGTQDHIFYRHPNVVMYRNTADFLDSLDEIV